MEKWKKCLKEKKNDSGQSRLEKQKDLLLPTRSKWSIKFKKLLSALNILRMNVLFFNLA